MSVSSQTKQTPKFTDMKEMKRWQAEREDQLHREHVREQLADHDRWVAECEKQRRDKERPTIKSPKSRRKKTH